MATILCPRALCLQSITAYVRVTRGPLAVRSSAAFTTASRHPRRSDLSNTATRPSIASQLQPSRTTLSAIAIRRQSTPSPVSSSTPPEDLLTWNRFFDLRKKRRWINLGCSVVTAAAAVGLVTPAIAAQDFDSWGAQISGLDPVIVLGISTFAIAAGGWLCGPSFGTAMFSLWAARRGWNKLIAEVSMPTTNRTCRGRTPG